jgi:uncharacterized protein with HEPN domain
MKTPDPQLYLLHIRDHCEGLAECARLHAGSTVPAWILFNAACRSLEIIGEASRKIGPDFRSAHPEVPWREMNDLRNVLIHHYEGADMDLIWRIIENDIPPLLAAVRNLIPPSSE